MEYLIHIGTLVGIYLILAQSFNLVFGIGRLFNLAHVATFALGAYTTALLATSTTLHPLILLAISALIAALFALLIGGISLRLTSDYFAIGSLAFFFVVQALLINWRSLTNGVLGIPGIPRPTLAGASLHDSLAFFAFVGTISLLTLVALYLLFRSSFARALHAYGEGDLVAQSLGWNTNQLRLYAFAIASTFAGISGALFAWFLNYIDPSSFSLAEMVLVLTIAIVGRPGSFWGVVVATVLLVGVIPESLRFLPLPSSVLGPLRQFIYATILFGIVWWRRFELFPVERKI